MAQELADEKGQSRETHSPVAGFAEDEDGEPNNIVMVLDPDGECLFNLGWRPHQLNNAQEGTNHRGLLFC